MNHLLELDLERAFRAPNPSGELAALRDQLSAATVRIEDLMRQVATREITIPDIRNFSGEEKLSVEIANPNPPWENFSSDLDTIPGMITEEECRYYSYIGAFYSGRGHAVEVGPWLGRSTFYIMRGLTSNPAFEGQKLHVYDDFIWRSSWMDERVTADDRLPNHTDFQFLFDRYTAPFRHRLHVEKRKVTTLDGNDAVPMISWSGEPIEILYVDCGRTFEVNEAWFQIFSRSFIPEKTLIVMQDWRVHREVPVKWYNQTKQFTDSKGNLELIHELKNGVTATFLVRGNSNKRKPKRSMNVSTTEQELPFTQYLRRTCEIAFEAGKELDLTGCFYGVPHRDAPFMDTPTEDYFFLAGLAKTQKIKTVFEIGTYWGGSIKSIIRGIAAAGNLTEEACVITTDVDRHNDGGFREHPDTLIQRLIGNVLEDSIYETVKRSLGDRPLDLLYVDGDHSYHATTRYVELYANALQPRFIVFDDIRLNDEMKLFWQHLTQAVGEKAFDLTDVINRPGAGFGIVQLRL